MKRACRISGLSVLSLAALALAVPGRAVSHSVLVPEYTLDSNGNKVGTAIPDFGISGGAPSLFPVNLNLPLASITDVNIRLEIEGGSNTDLMVYLLFGDDPADPFAVLLNQIQGSTSGMNAWLDDQSAYEVQTVGGVGVLSGTFRPAGPENLGAFNGLNPNAKTWYLAVADNSDGAESLLLEWELQISGPSTTPVPDTLGQAWLLGLAACFWIRVQKCRMATN